MLALFIKSRYTLFAVGILMVFLGGLWLNQTQPKRPSITQPQSPLIDFGQSVFNEVPKNPDAIFINRRFDYCEGCTFIGIWELYATNQSWDTVVAFYRARLQGTRWDCALVVNNYSCAVDAQSYPQIVINYNLGRSTVWYDRTSTQRALATGQTVYLIHMVFVENQAAFEQACPPGSLNTQTCQMQTWSSDDAK
jgi:hypothetical protein